MGYQHPSNDSGERNRGCDAAQNREHRRQNDAQHKRSSLANAVGAVDRLH